MENYPASDVKMIFIPERELYRFQCYRHTVSGIWVPEYDLHGDGRIINPCKGIGITGFFFHYSVLKSNNIRSIRPDFNLGGLPDQGHVGIARIRFKHQPGFMV
jgi:hypothetical protein